MDCEFMKEYSKIQEQFYLACHINTQNLSYNLVSLLDVKMSMDRIVFKKTLEIICNRHFISSTSDISNLLTIHNSPFNADDIQSLISIPFSLEKGPLFKCHLWISKGNTHILFIFHHIIFDLRSKDIFAHEFSEIYNALSKKQEIRLKSVPGYDQYIDWYKQFVTSEKYSKMLAYWEKEPLDKSLLNLPHDWIRQPVPSSRGHRIFGSIPMSLSCELNRYCHEHGSDLFLVLLAAYAVFLNRYSGQDRFSIGVPRTNRPPGFDETVGCFVNILPLCISMEEGMTFKNLLRHIRIKMLGMHRNQNIPYIELINLKEGVRDTKYNPLFQVGFTFEHPMFLEIEGTEVTPLDAAPDAAQLDLFFYFWNDNGVVRWAVEYCTDLFTRERVEGFFASFLTILEKSLENDNLSVNSMSLMDENSRNQIASWNNTDRDYRINGSVIDAFWDQARSLPEVTALIFRGETLNYGELARRVQCLAALLKAKGVEKETIVGLALERSFEMVIGMYAIVLSGGTYLPIEPTLPPDYISYIQEDSKLNLILSKEEFRSLFPKIETDCFVALDSFDFSREPEDSISFPSTDPDSRVYVLYTSGSTGRPKGVEITHRGLMNRLLWMDEEYRLTTGDVLFQKTPFNFDVSGWEFWWPLRKGIPLVVAEPEGHKDNRYLLETIEKEKITLIHFVPSMLREFLRICTLGACPTLRDVICSGETLPVSVVKEFYEILPHTRLHNLYGPTEASIDVSNWFCKPGCNAVPIGKPIANTKIYILDDKLNPLPPGVTGEIHLAGVQLARGYLNKPELTAERFISNPIDGERMYKTGDLGQWNLKGEILYMGRNDSQVQLHGLRIELGEIENAICNHPSVDTAAVIIHGDFGAEQSIIAYIVKREDVVAEEVIAFLSRRIPQHMVPKRIVFIDRIELNANGKLNRKSLPRPETPRSFMEKSLSLPEGEKEAIIADLWKEILKLDKVGRNENFFELGGSSIHIIQMQQKLSEQFGRSIPVKDLFIHTTIKELTKYLEKGNLKGDAEMTKLKNRAERSRNAALRLKNLRNR